MDKWENVAVIIQIALSNRHSSNIDKNRAKKELGGSTIKNNV